jgi:ABC-type sugar transport system permease subunit/ABC-type glycerol-3-phosphate transport system substrate-binding protein
MYTKRRPPLARKLTVALTVAFLFPLDAYTARRIPVHSADYVEEGEEFFTRANVAFYRDFLARHSDVVLVPFRPRHLPENVVPAERSRFFFAMLGEAGPDHVVSNPEDFQLHLEQHFLYPLDEYIFDVLRDRDGYPVDPDGHRLNSNKEDLFYKDRERGKYSVAVPMSRRVSVCAEWDGLPPLLRHLVVRDGKVYGIPLFHGFTCVIYRMDLLIAAGLDPKAPPRDWGEFIYVAQKLTDPNKPIRAARFQRGQAGLACAIDPSDEWLNYLWQAGGDAVHKLKFCPGGHRLEVRKEVDFSQQCMLCGKGLLEARESWAPAFDSDAGLVALQYYRLLRTIRWTRCPRCGEPVNVPRGAGTTAALTCNGPNGCKHTFPFPAPGQIYSGVVRDIEANGASDRSQRAAELFVTGEIAMLVVSQPYAFVAALPISYDKVGMMPLPSGWEWITCPRCRLPVILTGEMKESGRAVCPRDSVSVDLSKVRKNGGVSANPIQAMVWAINASSQKTVRDAVWQLIRYRMSGDGEAAITRSLVGQGHPEACRPTCLIAAGYRDSYQALPPGWMATEQQSLLSGRLAPYVPDWSAFKATGIAQMLKEVGSGAGIDVKASLQKTTEKCATAIRTENPAAETAHERGIPGILLPGAILLIVSLWWLSRAVARHKPSSLSAPVISGKKQTWPWILLAPALLSLLLWVCFPLLKAGCMTFHDWRADGSERLVGILNFADMLSSGAFWRVLLRTFLFVLLTVAFGVAAPLILALLLGEVPRGRRFFLAIFYLPALTTGVALALLWKMIYEPTENGFLNWLLLHMPRPTYLILPFLLMIACSALSALLFTRREFLPGAALILVSLGLLMLIPRIQPLRRPINWLGNARAGGFLPMIFIVVTGVWACAGLGSMIYLAALRSIPRALYECAELDGAGIFGKVRHVTLAELKPLIAINLAGALVGAFQAIRNIFVMTGGGPQGNTKVLALDVWYNAFIYLRFGYATALAWILVGLMIGFAVYHLGRLATTEFRYLPSPARMARQGKLNPREMFQKRA